MKNQLGIRGYVKVYITRENGIKELVFKDNNTILAAYANAIVDALDTGVGLDYSMDNLFNGNTASSAALNGQDGIAIKDSGGNWYEMLMAAPVVSAGEVLWVGTFTGVGITVALATEVKLGHDWQHAGLDFTYLFANPSSWVSQAVLAGETLTIEWTIKHQAT